RSRCKKLIDRSMCGSGIIEAVFAGIDAAVRQYRKSVKVRIFISAKAVCGLDYPVRGRSGPYLRGEACCRADPKKTAAWCIARKLIVTGNCIYPAIGRIVSGCRFRKAGGETGLTYLRAYRAFDAVIERICSGGSEYSDI